MAPDIALTKRAKNVGSARRWAKVQQTAHNSAGPSAVRLDAPGCFSPLPMIRSSDAMTTTGHQARAEALPNGGRTALALIRMAHLGIGRTALARIKRDRAVPVLGHVMSAVALKDAPLKAPIQDHAPLASDKSRAEIVRRAEVTTGGTTSRTDLDGSMVMTGGTTSRTDLDGSLVTIAPTTSRTGRGGLRRMIAPATNRGQGVVLVVAIVARKPTGGCRSLVPPNRLAR